MVCPKTIPSAQKLTPELDLLGKAGSLDTKLSLDTWLSGELYTRAMLFSAQCDRVIARLSWAFRHTRRELNPPTNRFADFCILSTHKPRLARGSAPIIVSIT